MFACSCGELMCNHTSPVQPRHRSHAPLFSATNKGRLSLDLLLQGRLEELEQQVLLPLVGGVVV